MDLQSTMTNELVFVETNLFASGRYTCHSVDTGKVLSDYRVTFVPGEDCLQLSGLTVLPEHILFKDTIVIYC